ncbi:unnamed protein product, partial [Linum tenue]
KKKKKQRRASTLLFSFNQPSTSLSNLLQKRAKQKRKRECKTIPISPFRLQKRRAKSKISLLLWGIDERRERKVRNEAISPIPKKMRVSSNARGDDGGGGRRKGGRRQ